jgi:hypothetical protein
MGSSKHFEMAFEVHNKIRKNRIIIFLSYFTEEQMVIRELFKHVVGDFSKEY